MWAAILAMGFGLLVAAGTSWTSFVLTTLIAALVFFAIGSRMRSEPDRGWLVKWVMLGLAAKVVGSLARYYMVAVFYEGGDSYRYFEVGNELADIWHRGRIPELSGAGAFGTQILEYVSGILFAAFSPDMLGGFLIFAVLAYCGQLMLYAAFRRWAIPNQLKTYAFFLLFLPTFMFWPSSIGKDAVIIFAIGGAAYFISRLLVNYEVRWLLGLAVFLGFVGLIRIHIAALVVIGLVGAGLLSKVPGGYTPAVAARRALTLAGFVAAGILVLAFFPDILGVDLTTDQGLESFTSDIVRRTSEKGTVAAGGPVTSLADVPNAVALVLFRPFIFEATELQHLLAAAETTLLLGLTVWKLPTIVRNHKAWRANAYTVFSTVYVLGFCIAFSVVRNLGIIARQRGQVLAFFLAIVVGMGWTRTEEESAVTPPISAVREPNEFRGRQRSPDPTPVP